MNSQPDNNPEKINPVSHLATIFGADCNLFSTGFGTGIHPSVPRHAMLGKGGSSGRILAAGKIWSCLCPLSGRGLCEPARDRAAGDETAKPLRAPLQLSHNPSPSPLAGTRNGGAGRGEPHPHRCFPTSVPSSAR